MKNEILTQSVNGLGAIAAASGIATMVMKFFDYYAAGIGAVFTIATFFTWLVFQFRNDKKLALADENKQELKEFKVDTAKEFKKINTGIESILEEIKDLLKGNANEKITKRNKST